MRQAAHAFNTMQNRLASYLEDRLHILAAVSHDLKTPITRLKLRAEMLPEQGLPATVQRDRFIRDLDEMETLIGASLDFLRGESRQERTVPLDINALLASLRDDLANRQPIENPGNGRSAVVGQAAGVEALSGESAGERGALWQQRLRRRPLRRNCWC